MPPQAALGGFFVTAPSVFTFSQFAIGGCHITREMVEIALSKKLISGPDAVKIVLQLLQP